VKERPILFSGPMVRALLDGRKTQTRRIVKPQHVAYIDEHQGFREPCNAEVCPYGAPGDRLWVRETLWVSECGKWFMCDGPQGTFESGIFNEHERYVYRTAEMFERGETPRFMVSSWYNQGRYIKGKNRRWVPAFDLNAMDMEQPGKYAVQAKFRKHRPAIHMPRWASRLVLEVTGVRVERLCDISEADAQAEGVAPFFEVYKGMGQEQTISTGERAADAPHRASFACLWDEINGDRALWKSNPWVWVVEFKRAEPTPGQTEGGR